MIFTIAIYKNPLPPVLSVHTGIGFIAANDLAMAHLRSDRLRSACRLSRPLDKRHGATFAQWQIEDLATNLDQPFKSKMMFVMQAYHQGFQTRAKRAPRFQTRGPFPTLAFSATGTDALVLPGLDHHRLNLGQLGDLTTDDPHRHLLQQIEVTVGAVVHIHLYHSARILLRFFFSALKSAKVVERNSWRS